jgi:hypothetical protein
MADDTYPKLHQAKALVVTPLDWSLATPLPSPAIDQPVVATALKMDAILFLLN